MIFLKNKNIKLFCEASFLDNKLAISTNQYGNGLFSTASITLANLISIHRKILITAEIKWYSNIWGNYDYYFETNPNIILGQNNTTNSSIENILIQNNKTIFSKIDYNLTSEILNKYFLPSQNIKNVSEKFIKKYNIDFNKIIGLRYRGTDKINERSETNINFYTSEIERYLEKEDRIFLQTDQQQTYDHLKKIYKEKLFNLEELPMTNGNSPFHRMKEINNKQLGTNYVASIILMSHCKSVIFDTGNASLWICLYRGGMKNTTHLRSDDNEVFVERN